MQDNTRDFQVLIFFNFSWKVIYVKLNSRVFLNFDFKRSENTVDPSYTHIQCGFVLHGIWTAV